MLDHLIYFLVRLRIFRFSAPSALRVYGLYLNLDRDHNGMLSMEELQSYGTGTMTTGTPPSGPYRVIFI